MNPTTTITCPNCHAAIEVSEVLSAQLTTQIRAELDAELRAARAGLEKQSAELRAQQAALEQGRAQLDEEVGRRLAAERQKLLEQARQKAAADLAVELGERDERLGELDQKLKAAQQNELELRRRERELKTKAEEQELELTRRLNEERDRIRQEALKRAADEHALRHAEKDRKIAELVQQLEEMKRKAEQGSQQAQGEVLELALEELLRQRFPADAIEEVVKGARGGDVVQRVISPAGLDCGSILWEAKRTKNWSDAWLAKLRHDQREAKAACAVLVSTALPERIEHFGQVEGVWVCSWACAVQVGAVLRAGLLEVGKARRALEGQHGKMEALYQYLSGTEFRNRVTGIVEAFVALRSDLEREKAALQRHWARREKQLEQAVQSTAGMYGDLQGLIGASLPEIDGMALLTTEELPALDDQHPA